MAGWFKAGGFYFPTVTGDYEVVDDLPGEPQGVIFFGGNQVTEDSFIQPTAPGIFIGMAWHDVDSDAVDFQSQANVKHGVRWRSSPIHMLSTSTTVEYEADSITFDANGFTIHVNDAAPAARLVHWLAWGDWDEARGKSVGGTGGPSTFMFPAAGSLDARPLTVFDFAMFSSGASRDSAAANAEYLTCGAAAFPGYDTDLLVNGANNNATHISMRASGGLAEGFTQKYYNILDDAITASVAPGPAGTWQTNIDHLRPWPNWISPSIRLQTYGRPNRQQVVWWSAEGSTHGVSSPAVGVTSVVSGGDNTRELVAALFFGIGDYGSEEELGVNAGYMIGVLTPDYQGCVAYDAGFGNAPAVSPGGFFQSQSRCIATNLHSGVRASSGELVENTVELTGEIDSGPGGGSVAALFWGGPSEALWLPHMSRWEGGGATGGIPVTPDTLLMEDGGKILLEEGTGFLIF